MTTGLTGASSLSTVSTAVQDTFPDIPVGSGTPIRLSGNGRADAAIPTFLAVLAATLTGVAATVSGDLLPADVMAVGLLLLLGAAVALARRGERVNIGVGVGLMRDPSWSAGSISAATCLIALLALLAGGNGVDSFAVVLLWLAAGAVLAWLITAPASAAPRQWSRVGVVIEAAELPDLLLDLPAHVVPMIWAPHDMIGLMTDGETASRRIIEMCRFSGVDTVVMSTWPYDNRTWDHVSGALAAVGLSLQRTDEFLEESLQRVALEHVSSLSPAGSCADADRGYRIANAALDLVAGVLMFCALLLLGPIIATAVKIDSPGPVFYRQRRVGLGGEEFDMLKFRTMKTDAERAGAQFASAGDVRVTSAGRLLRRSRLDELPQAVNLLRRDMSLIGPRPERPEFVAQYRREIPGYDQRHGVRPGITGWAQVTEGYVDDLTGTRRKVERDLYYIKHRSVHLDVRIITETIRCFLLLDGR